MKIREAQTPEEIMRCFPVMAHLREHLEQTEFLSLIQSMSGEGFRLAYLEHDATVVCVAGFRISTTLFMGKNLYVDDLVAHKDCRSQGFGEAMLAWLRELGASSGCEYLHLDSGTQRQRAHKFYLSQGMFISAFHFAEKLGSD